MYRSRTTTAGRIGTSIDSGAECQVSFERLYSVMGASSGSLQLPGRVGGNPDLNTFPALTAGDAQDWDEDGNAGLTYIVTNSPIGSGTKYVLQRRWRELSGPVAYKASEFLIPIAWDVEELVVAASNVFLTSSASVRQSPHMAKYQRVVSSVVGASDNETCANLRALMPHSSVPMDGF